MLCGASTKVSLMCSRQNVASCCRPKSYMTESKGKPSWARCKHRPATKSPCSSKPVPLTTTIISSKTIKDCSSNKPTQNSAVSDLEGSTRQPSCLLEHAPWLPFRVQNRLGRNNSRRPAGSLVFHSDSPRQNALYCGRRTALLQDSRGNQFRYHEQHCGRSRGGLPKRVCVADFVCHIALQPCSLAFYNSTRIDHDVSITSESNL